MMLDWIILALLSLAACGWLAAVFFYVTKPARPRRWYRVPSRAWLNSVGVQIVTQKLVLTGIVAFIWAVRLFGDFPARNWIAVTLYGLVALEAWFFFVNQRRIQREIERRK